MGAARPLSRLGSEAASENKEISTYAETDAAAAAGAARIDAAEEVVYINEVAGGNGVLRDSNQARKFKAFLQQAALDHGVGSWETQVGGQRGCGCDASVVLFVSLDVSRSHGLVALSMVDMPANVNT